MTSFGWKRKVGERVSREKSAVFEKEAKDESDDVELEGGDIDWLTLAPRRKVVCLEDGVEKSKRLKEEGAVLAAEERFWEALKKWDGAIELNPQDASLHEMKAQAYMQLCEVNPALQAATRATNIDPLWWVAWQTLGRAHLGLGEVRTALRCFCKAVHLYPADSELWKEDMAWARDLLHRKQQMQEEAERATQAKLAGKVRELNEDGSSSQLLPYEDNAGLPANINTDAHSDQELDSVPSLTSGNYVLMWDSVT